MFPKVTTDLKEFLRLTGEKEFNLYATGLYLDGIIWLKTLSPKTLFHEMGHHIIGHTSDPKICSIALFKCILHTLWDIFSLRYGTLRVHKEQKNRIPKQIRESFKDFLDWTRRREP